jgi:hypothetical protein
MASQSGLSVGIRGHVESLPRAVTAKPFGENSLERALEKEYRNLPCCFPRIPLRPCKVYVNYCIFNRLQGIIFG